MRFGYLSVGALTQYQDLPLLRDGPSQRRRDFLKLGGVAAGTAALGVTSFPQVSRAQTITLKMQSSWGASDIFQEMAKQYTDRCEKIAGGRLKFDLPGRRRREGLRGPECLSYRRTRVGEVLIAADGLLDPEVLCPAIVGDAPVFIKDAWADTTSPHGRLMLAVLGGLVEF